MALVWTIGYGGRRAPELVADLQDYRVTHLVDVRSSPHSLWHPEFTIGLMVTWLPREGIEYLHLGRGFGGRVAPQFLVPEAYPQRPAFEESLTALQEILDAGGTPCLMCAERHPQECHRARLVAPALIDRGIEVRHILADGTDATQDELPWPHQQRTL